MLRSLLASQVALFTRPLLEVLSEACISLFNHGDERAAKPTVEFLLKQAASNVRSAEASGPHSSRVACVYLLGEICAAFGPLVSSEVSDVVTLLVKLGSGSSSSAASSGGAGTAGLHVGIGGSSADQRDADGAPVRAAAATALYRTLEGAGAREGAKVHASVLKHIQSVIAIDPCHAVRMTLGPCIQALATSSSAFATVPLDACLRLATAGICDSHPSVCLGSALGLASALSVSVVAARVGAVAADAAAVGAHRMRGGDDGSDDDDGDASSVADGDDGGAGGNEGAGADQDEDGPGAGSSAGAGGDAGGSGSQGSSSKRPSSTRMPKGPNFGKAFARLKSIGDAIGGKSAGASSSAANEASDGGGGKRHSANSASLSASEAAAISAADAVSPTGRSGNALTRALARARFGRNKGDGVVLSFNTASAIAYITMLMRHAGKLASRHNGAKAGDIRAALSVAGGALLRTVRGAAGGLPDAEVKDVVASVLSSLADNATRSSDSDEADGVITSLHQISIVAGGLPPSGPHAVHMRSCCLHILTHGLADAPQQQGCFVQEAWTRWQRLLLDTVIGMISTAAGAASSSSTSLFSSSMGQQSGAGDASAALLSKVLGADAATASGGSSAKPSAAHTPAPGIGKPPRGGLARSGSNLAAITSKLSLRRSKAKGGAASNDARSSGQDRAAETPADAAPSDPLSHAAVAVLLEFSMHLLPRACALGSADMRVAVEQIVPSCLSFLASHTHALRLTAASCLRICGRACPSLLPDLVASCTATIRHAHAALATGPAQAATAAAAAATALADAAAFTAHRKANLPGTVGASKRVARVAGTSGGVMANGALASASCAGGVGIPGAGRGSGCCVCIDEEADELVRLHGHSLALAVLVAASADVADSSPLPSAVASTESSVGADQGSPARSVLPLPLLSDALSLATALLSVGRDAKLKHVTPTTLPSVHAMQQSASSQQSAAQSSAAATAALAQSAAAAAAAEVEAACVRAGSAILSSLCRLGPAWLVSPSIWPAVHTLLAEDMCRALVDVDGAGIGSARDGSGAYVLSPLGVPQAVAAATSLIMSSSSASSTSGQGSNSSSPHVSGGGGTTADGADNLGIATARSVYCGLAAAWTLAGFASTSVALLSTVLTAADRVAASPAALQQVTSLVRLGLSVVTAARVPPSSISAYMSQQHHSRHSGARMFADAAAALSLRMPSGTAVTLGAAAAAGPDGVSSPAANLLGLDPALVVTASSAAAPVVRGITYSLDDAYMYSPCGVSLPAIALARRSVLHAAACLLEAASCLPMHVMTTLPLRGPLLCSAVTVLSGASLSLVPLEMGLLNAQTAEADAKGRDGASQTRKREPRAIPTAVDSQAADASVSLLLASIRPDEDTWSPLAVAMSHSPAPQLDRSLSTVMGDDSSVLEPVSGWSATYLAGSATDAALPESLAEVFSGNACSSLDSDMGVLTSLCSPSCSAPAVLAGCQSPDSSWDYAVRASSITEDAALSHETPVSSPGSPSHPLLADVKTGQTREVTTPLHVVQAALESELSSPHKYPSLFLQPGVSSDPGMRMAHASVAVITAILPMLPLGQANALVTAISSPLRDWQNDADSDGSMPTVGYRHSPGSLSVMDGKLAARNAASVLLSTLHCMRREHVVTATGDESAGSDDVGQPVPWILTLRTALGSALVHSDPIVRRACGQSIAELCRLGGDGFGRRLLSALQKQVRKPATEAEQPPPGKGGASSAAAAAIVSPNQAPASLTPHGKAGVLYAIACAARYAAASVLASGTTGSVVSRLADENRNTDGWTCAERLLDVQPSLLHLLVEEEIVFESAKQTKEPLRSWAMHAWQLLIEAAVDNLRAAVHANNADPDGDQAAVVAAVLHLRKFVQPALALMEAHALVGHSPFDAGQPVWSSGSTTTKQQVIKDVDSLASYLSVSLGAGSGAVVDTIDAHNSDLPNVAAFASEVTGSYSTSLAAGGGVAVAHRYGGAIALECVADAVLLGYASPVPATAVLPVHHPATFELLPPPSLLSALESAAASTSATGGIAAITSMSGTRGGKGVNKATAQALGLAKAHMRSLATAGGQAATRVVALATVNSLEGVASSGVQPIPPAGSSEACHDANVTFIVASCLEALTRGLAAAVPWWSSSSTTSAVDELHTLLSKCTSAWSMLCGVANASVAASCLQTSANLVALTDSLPLMGGGGRISSVGALLLPLQASIARAALTGPGALSAGQPVVDGMALGGVLSGAPLPSPLPHILACLASLSLAPEVCDQCMNLIGCWMTACERLGIRWAPPSIQSGSGAVVNAMAGAATRASTIAVIAGGLLSGLVPCAVPNKPQDANTASSVGQALDVTAARAGKRPITAVLSLPPAECSSGASGLALLAASQVHRPAVLQSLGTAVTRIVSAHSNLSVPLPVPGHIVSLGIVGDLLLVSDASGLAWHASRMADTGSSGVKLWLGALSMRFGASNVARMSAINSLVRRSSNDTDCSEFALGLLRSLSTSVRDPAGLNSSEHQKPLGGLSIEWVLGLCDAVNGEHSKSEANAAAALQARRNLDALSTAPGGKDKKANKPIGDFGPSQPSEDDDDAEQGGDAAGADADGGDAARATAIAMLDSDAARAASIQPSATEVLPLVVDTGLWRGLGRHGKAVALQFLTQLVSSWKPSTSRNGELHPHAHHCLSAVLRAACAAMTSDGDGADDDDEGAEEGGTPAAPSGLLDNAGAGDAAASDLRYRGLQLLCALIDVTAAIPDPDLPSAHLLQQYQANLLSALGPCLAPDVSSHVQRLAIRAALGCIKCGIACDPGAVRRLLRLTLAVVPTDAQSRTMAARCTRNGKLSDLAFLGPRRSGSGYPITMMDDDVLASWACRLGAVAEILSLAGHVPAKALFESTPPRGLLPAFAGAMARQPAPLSPTMTIRLSPSARAAAVSTILPHLGQLLLCWQGIVAAPHALGAFGISATAMACTNTASAVMQQRPACMVGIGAAHFFGSLALRLPLFAPATSPSDEACDNTFAPPVAEQLTSASQLASALGWPAPSTFAVILSAIQDGGDIGAACASASQHVLCSGSVPMVSPAVLVACLRSSPTMHTAMAIASSLLSTGSLATYLKSVSAGDGSALHAIVDWVTATVSTSLATVCGVQSGSATDAASSIAVNGLRSAAIDELPSQLALLPKAVDIAARVGHSKAASSVLSISNAFFMALACSSAKQPAGFDAVLLAAGAALIGCIAAAPSSSPEVSRFIDTLLSRVSPIGDAATSPIPIGVDQHKMCVRIWSDVLLPLVGHPGCGARVVAAWSCLASSITSALSSAPAHHRIAALAAIDAAAAVISAKQAVGGESLVPVALRAACDMLSRLASDHDLVDASDVHSMEGSVTWANSAVLSCTRLAASCVSTVDAAAGDDPSLSQVTLSALLPLLIPYMTPGQQQAGDATSGSNQDQEQQLSIDTGWVSPETSKSVSQSALSLAQASPPSFKAALVALDSATRERLQGAMRSGLAGQRLPTRFQRGAPDVAAAVSAPIATAARAGVATAVPASGAPKLGLLSSKFVAAAASPSQPPAAAPGRVGLGLKVDPSKFAAPAAPAAKPATTAASSLLLSVDEEDDWMAKARRAREMDSDDDEEEEGDADGRDQPHQKSAGGTSDGRNPASSVNEVTASPDGDFGDFDEA